MTTLNITVAGIRLTADLEDNATGEAVLAALPIDGRANVWGEEIYFAIPVELAESKDAGELREVGDLAYWPPGNAFCIFFGPTPASDDARPRAASPVNPFGRIRGDARVLKQVPDGSPIRIERG